MSKTNLVDFRFWINVYIIAAFIPHDSCNSDFFLPPRHTHAHRLFTPTHWLLPPCYSQLLVIPRLTQNDTISLSVRFMPNLMSPCRAGLCQEMGGLLAADLVPSLCDNFHSDITRWDLELHSSQAGGPFYTRVSPLFEITWPHTHLDLSLSSHLYHSSAWHVPVSVNRSICCPLILWLATTVYVTLAIAAGDWLNSYTARTE